MSRASDAAGVLDLVADRRLIREHGRRIRTSASLSLAEAAAAVDVSHVAVWRWETGARQPRVSLARRYAAFLRALEKIE